MGVARSDVGECCRDWRHFFEWLSKGWVRLWVVFFFRSGALGGHMVGSAAVEATLFVDRKSCAVGFHVSVWTGPPVSATAYVVEIVANLYATYLVFTFTLVFLALALGLLRPVL